MDAVPQSVSRPEARTGAEPEDLRERIQREIREVAPNLFASKRILECTPFLFNGDVDLYISWKQDLGARLKIDPRAIVITGSAAVGISLNPYKNFKAFDDSSDVDVAVISSFHFEVGWHFLRNLGSERYRLNQRAQTAVEEHRTRHVYWGVIATDRLLEYLPFAMEWLSALSHMASIDPTKGRDVAVRVYRDFEALRSYQVFNLRSLQRNLLERS